MTPWTVACLEFSRCTRVGVGVLIAQSLFATPWTLAHQSPLSMEFSRQEYRSGLVFPSPGDLPDLGAEPRFPALQADSLPSEPPGKPLWIHWLSRYFLSISSSFSPWDPCSRCFLPVSCFTPRSYMEHAYHILIAKCQFHRKGFPDSTIQCSHPVPHFHITFL